MKTGAGQLTCLPATGAVLLLTAGAQLRQGQVRSELAATEPDRLLPCGVAAAGRDETNGVAGEPTGLFQAMVDMQQDQRGYRGCPLGSITSQVLDHAEPLGSRAADAFIRWKSSLSDGLRAMQPNGLLRDDADPDALVESTIAVLQGGYLVSSTKRDVRPMLDALTAALGQLRSYATPETP